MTDEPGSLPETPQPSDSSSPSLTVQPIDAPVKSRGRSAGTRACPNCGNSISAHASVCPACGEGLQERSGNVRCKHCGERSAAELTLCPVCGRELASAPSRILTWAIPFALVFLFLVLIVRQSDGSNPLAWAQDRLTIEGFPSRDASARGLVVVMTPVAADTQSPEEATASDDAQITSVLATVSEADAPVAANAETSPDAAAVSSEAAPAAEGSAATNVADEAAVDAALPEPTVARPDEEIAASVSLSGTEDAADEEAAKPEATETPATKTLPIETPPTTDNSEDGVLVSAASVSEAAAQAELPTATATSTETATPVLTRTPTATLTPVPTETATSVPMPTYEIRRGDTLVVVAKKHDVSVKDLMRVNGIAPAQAFTIQPGQELLIPVEGSSGAQEPTTTPTATLEPTPVVPATNTPVPTPTTPAVRLDAPILRSPEPGTPVSCSDPGSLAWLPVPFMRADDRFVLHLGFSGGRTEDGRDMVVWVLEQPRPVNATSWDMDGGLCALAPQEFGRKWHWYVEVAEEVDGMLRPVSPPSETWYFSWN